MLPQRFGFIKKNAIYKERIYPVHLEEKFRAVAKLKLV